MRRKFEKPLRAKDYRLLAARALLVIVTQAIIVAAHFIWVGEVWLWHRMK